MKLSFFQVIDGDLTNVGRKYEIEPKGDTVVLSKQVGTACRALGLLLSAQSEGGASFFKLNEPLHVRIEGKTGTVDTSQFYSAMQAKLKVNRTPKSQSRFAKRVLSFAQTMQAIESLEVISTEDLQAELASKFNLDA